MDPDEALKNIREMVTEWTSGGYINADEFIEVVDGLDKWMSSGGYAPAAWQD